MCADFWFTDMSTPTKKVTNRRNLQNDPFMRTPRKEEPVFGDIQIILFLLKAAGMLPIYEQISYYEVGPPTKSNQFYSFFVRGIVHALTIFYIYSLFTANSSQLFYSYRETDNVNQWIEILLCILTYSITVWICARNANAILRIMNDLLKLDEEVQRKYDVQLSHSCGFSVKFLVGIGICQAYITVLKVLAVEGHITPVSYILIGFYAMQNVLSTAFIVFESVLMRIVTIRFAYLNRILMGYTYIVQQRSHTHKRRDAFVASHAPKPALAAARLQNFPNDSLFVYRMHNQLLRIYKAINEWCSLILVGYMGYAFYTITTNTYNLFVLITTKGSVSSNILQWCFAWLLMHSALLALLSRSCGQATKEANTTSQILARIYGKDKEMQNIIDKFLTKSIKQEVQFTAYGFFIIDNSTLFKIFSAVTTYLVILIQFKQLEDSKMEEHANSTTTTTATTTITTTAATTYAF